MRLFLLCFAHCSATRSHPPPPTKYIQTARTETNIAPLVHLPSISFQITLRNADGSPTPSVPPTAAAEQ